MYNGTIFGCKHETKSTRSVLVRPRKTRKFIKKRKKEISKQVHSKRVKNKSNKDQ